MWIAGSDVDDRTWNRLRQAVFGGQESPGEIHRLDNGRLLLITGDRETLPDSTGELFKFKTKWKFAGVD